MSTIRNVTFYTKKYDLKFDQNGVSMIDVTSLLEELSNEYIILDPVPTIIIEGAAQYVTVKLSKIEARKKIGF